MHDMNPTELLHIEKYVNRLRSDLANVCSVLFPSGGDWMCVLLCTPYLACAPLCEWS